MKSDIILNDDNVEIIGSPVTIKGYLTLKDSNGNQFLRLNKNQLLIEDGLIIHLGPTQISSQYFIADRIHGKKINANELGASKLNANEIFVGPISGEGSTTSKLIINNNKGLPIITIDGANEDIIFKSIGSLLKKINQLETEIASLKMRRP